MNEPAIKIAMVQYDGDGLWVDVSFSNGDRVRFSAADLWGGYKLAKTLEEIRNAGIAQTALDQEKQKMKRMTEAAAKKDGR